MSLPDGSRRNRKQKHNRWIANESDQIMFFILVDHKILWFPEMLAQMVAAWRSNSCTTRNARSFAATASREAAVGIIKVLRRPDILPTLAIRDSETVSEAIATRWTEKESPECTTRTRTTTSKRRTFTSLDETEWGRETESVRLQPLNKTGTWWGIRKTDRWEAHRAIKGLEVVLAVWAIEPF